MLIIKQVMENLHCTERDWLSALSNCSSEVHKLFSSIRFEHVPQAHKKHSDALVNLLSKSMILKRQQMC